jgi:hypothetical protein
MVDSLIHVASRPFPSLTDHDLKGQAWNPPMKKHSNLALMLLAAFSGIGLSGCGESEPPPNIPVGTGGAAGGSMAGAAGTIGGAGGLSAGGTGGMAGSSGEAGLAGSGGAGPVCEVPSLETFARSDTAATWDDNDFSDVVLEQGVCPVLVDVTWPHEAAWENADPSNANFEQVHFTLDSYPSVNDLTGKQLNVTIELAEDMLGPLATDGGYIVSLLSVSTFQRVVPGGAGGNAGASGAGGEMAGMGGISGIGGTMAGMAGAGMSGASGTAGMSGASGMSGAGGAGAGGMSGGAGMAAGAGGMDAIGGTAGDAGGASGSGGQPPVTEIAYAEAETPVAERRVLYYPGDKVTVRFPLPAKTAADSYDPASVLKVNIRIYSRFDPGEDEPTGGAGAGGMAGMGGMSGAGASGMSGSAGAGGMSGASGSAGMSGTAGTSGMAGMSGMATAGMSGEAGTAGAAGATGMGGAGGTGSMEPPPVYDYLTSRFAITSFTITDVGAL